MEKRLEEIKLKHYSETFGSEFGVGEFDVDWLIKQAEIVEEIKQEIKGRWSTDTVFVNHLYQIINK